MIIKDFPLKILIGFNKIIEQYEELQNSDDTYIAKNAIELLEELKPYPILRDGFDDISLIDKLKTPIGRLLSNIFPKSLTTNEIKALTVPFQKLMFYKTERFKTILKNAGDDFEMDIRDFDDDELYIMGCSIILNFYYGYKVDFNKPLFYDIPDKNGLIRHYRFLYNADFTEIKPTEKAVDITKEDVALLIDNFDNIELWREKFPPQSWVFKGIGIVNLFDATIESTISNLKTNLISSSDNSVSFKNAETVFKTIFNLPDLKLGFTAFNCNNYSFETIPVLNAPSLILNDKESQNCKTVLCNHSYELLINKNEYYTISDVDAFYEKSNHNLLSSNLKSYGIKSCILAPVVNDKEFLGVLELASPNKYELNSINANKLDAVLPYLSAAVKRSKEELENQIDAVIQKECTSIHSSVIWRFQQEAAKFLVNKNKGEKASFEEIVFDVVYPLYGQIDINGSSTARNNAIQKDLSLQLDYIIKIINLGYELEPLPIYEEVKLRVEECIVENNKPLKADTEQNILDFIKKEIHPIFDHLQEMYGDKFEIINEYNKILDPLSGVVYNERKKYDDSVMTINQTMASVIDKKQDEAQRLYPHYFERYKTDGVEHNMYIGKSMTFNKPFSKLYLQNLRLWQLQVMCEMENEYYHLQNNLPLKLKVSSLILVYNNPISIRFRMDEKRFDVDGTYNARYEIIKKRVDKAFVKGTKKRITQSGLITIVYSQKKDEQEYKKYIKLLQSKKQLAKEIEYIELEDLQGVTGLKAMQVKVLYNNADDDKAVFTYDDLMKEISSN